MDQKDLTYEELDAIAGTLPESPPVGQSYRPDCLAHGSDRHPHQDGVLTCLRCNVYVDTRHEVEPTCWSCGLDDQLSKYKIHFDMVQFRAVGVDDLMSGENPHELPEPEGF